MALQAATDRRVDNPGDTGRTELPVAGDEVETLLGSLDRTRAYIAWKCGDLDSAGLSTKLGPSEITLGGLLKHLAHVEDFWFSSFLFDRAPHPLWDLENWDRDWTSAADDTPDEIYAIWNEAVQRSRALIDEALADGGLDRLADHKWPDGRAPNLRRMIIDVIEEYARHLGHADLIRESIDGLVGEDPPD